MTETTKNVIRLVYHALISVALVTAAVLLMVACVTIYQTGDFPFTRQVVAQEFHKIAIPVYLCLGLVAAGFILHPLLPTNTDTNKDRERMMVRRLYARTNLALCPAELANAIRQERKVRSLHRLVTVALFAIGLGVLLWYTLSFDRFSMEDINGSFVNFGCVLLPCLLLPAGYGVFSLFYNRKSYRRELNCYRQVPAEAKVDAPAPAGKKPWDAVVRHTILVAAIGLIVGGWLAGGWVDVLTKAINICTECVGLG